MKSEKKFEHELSDRVQFQSDSILNTAHHFSITCVGFPEFLRHIEGMWNSDGDEKWMRGAEWKIPHRDTRCRVVNGSHRLVLLTLTCMFENGPSCHRRAWLEYQFEPFFVGSLYSRVARKVPLWCLTLGMLDKAEGKTEGYLGKKKRGHKKDIGKDIRDIFKFRQKGWEGGHVGMRTWQGWNLRMVSRGLRAEDIKEAWEQRDDTHYLPPETPVIAE